MNIDRPCPCRLLLIAVAVFSVAFAPHLRAVDRGFVKANVVEALAQEECCTYLAALPVNHGDFSRWERFTGVGLAVGIWVSFFASVFCGPSHLGATVGCSNGPSLVTQHIRLQN